MFKTFVSLLSGQASYNTPIVSGFKLLHVTVLIYLIVRYVMPH